jgi:hypothetical protein
MKNPRLRLPHLFLIAIFAFLFSSCFEEEKYQDTQAGNFEALWKIMNENYCFFEYKKVNWDSIHTAYAARISENMSDEALFTVLGEMIGELKDGHVNLSAAHDLARNWSWKENYPDNFDEKIQKNYLGTDYQIVGGLKYKILDDNIGYIYYESFSNNFGESNLDQIISKMSICKGIIIDIRNNGGGYLTNADKLASRFFKDKTLVGYIRHKTGKGHNDFSTPYPIYVEPSKRINFLEKPVAVLTNRSCFSSANDFVNLMSYAPNKMVVGDNTGGGSGLPFSSELPNGWSVRFSSSPMTNAKDQQIEFGIAPDYKIDMSDEDIKKGLDTIIEKARELINSKS